MEVGNPTPVLNVASGVPNSGTFAWTVPNSLTPDSDYLIRVTREYGSGVYGVSSAPFTIASPITTYYVNGATVTPDGFTTAPGSDTNDGLKPGSPMASIEDVLHTYQLLPGATIMVDAGTYNLSSNILLAAADSGIIIEGYSNASYPNLSTVLNRGNTNSGAYVIQMVGPPTSNSKTCN